MAALEVAAQLDEAEHIGNALGFEGTVIKTGYLVKRAKKSGSNWKRRYFVLNASSLLYFESHKRGDDAKGALLLTVDTAVRDVIDAKYSHCFEVVTSFETLRMAASSRGEAIEWKSSILQTVQNAIAASMRGFLNVQTKKMFGSKAWARRFFVLHSSAITYHEDHYKTHKKIGEFKLNPTTRIINCGDLELELLGESNKSLRMQMKSEDERAAWRDAVAQVVTKLAGRDDLASKRGQQNDESVIIDGYLTTTTQPSTHTYTKSAGGASSSSSSTGRGKQRLFYALTSSALYQASGHHSPEALNVFLLDPSCSVSPTTVHSSTSFELVTSRKVLHLAAQGAEECRRWVMEIRNVISRSTGLNSDPLLTAAKRIKMSEYSVTYHTKRTLNIVLERAAEWALVKSRLVDDSTTDAECPGDENITEGSALIGVNDTPTVLMEYDETIRMLTAWQPPLTLTFARAPEKRGWLGKQARGRRRATNTKTNWRTRYFVLQGGTLSYYIDETKEALKGKIPLAGSAVSLVSREETVGFNFCFRISFGIGELVMQATTLEEMVEWASTLYHAIAIANGGGYLLDVERQRLLNPEDDQDDDNSTEVTVTTMPPLLAEGKRSSVKEEECVVDPTLDQQENTLLPSSRDTEDADDSQEIEDEDSENVVSEILEKGEKQQKSKRQPHSVVVDIKEDLLSTPLTDCELANVYSVVENDKGYINAMQFSCLLRAIGVSDSENLDFELDLFHLFSDDDGNLTKEQFVSGFQEYFEKQKVGSNLLRVSFISLSLCFSRSHGVAGRGEKNVSRHSRLREAWNCGHLKRVIRV